MMVDRSRYPPGMESIDRSMVAMTAAAVDMICEKYAPDRHSVAAAVRDDRGRVHLAVNLDAYVGRAAVCAEAIAIGAAVAVGAREIDRIVAVRHPRPEAPDRRLHIAAPCGLCRELLLDYAPNAHVLIAKASGEVGLSVARDLMPDRFERLDKPRPA